MYWYNTNEQYTGQWRCGIQVSARYSSGVYKGCVTFRKVMESIFGLWNKLIIHR